ncbi:MAG: putative ACR [Pseudomonas shahriarae]|nr:Uncharacterized ACR, COG1993 [Pseudomonas fluorescens]
MKGFLVVFFTQQNRRYQGKMLGEWIVDLAKEMGLRGATLSTGIEGFGHTGRLHSAHFFELADQPTPQFQGFENDIGGQRPPGMGG